jgi:O-antigen/teichoic acid export membrane protein
VNRLGRQVSLHQLMVSLTIFYVIWINLGTLYAFIPNGANYAGGVGVVLLLGLAKVVNSSFSIGTDVLNYSRHYSRSLLFILLLTLSAIGLNTWLIGLWGIDGSAAATLVSYLIYFAVLLGYLWWRVGVSLFSAGQLKVVVLLAAAFGLGALWEAWLTPLVAPQASLAGLLADAVLKTLALGGALLAAFYAWRVSPTMNQLMAGIVTKIFNRKQDKS